MDAATQAAPTLRHDAAIQATPTPPAEDYLRFTDTSVRANGKYHVTLSLGYLRLIMHSVPEVQWETWGMGDAHCRLKKGDFDLLMSMST